jgi:outer membrane protein assembly factor BamB
MRESVPATAAYTASDSASALVQVLDEYFAALQNGTPPNKAALLAKYPELAGQLDSCIAALDFIHQAGTSRPAGETPTQLGDFRIVREIGRGGMGVVYEAEQLSLHRPVALKVLRFGAADPGAMDRFKREAETVAKLHHTNIVPVFAVGCEAGVHFYAMQLIDGVGLDKSFEMNPGFAAVARWGVQAAEALAHAHARGIIHRDIKPSNLLLDREGTVWLTDFGLARQSSEVTLTVTGMLLGTPRYMSPEQADATQHKVDARSDVYSLGATLYELATGKPVHDGETPQRVLAQILQEEPIPPRQYIPDMPRDFETVLLKCLAKEPNDRYGTAQELADDLRRFANGEPIKARRPSFRERAARWAKKHRKQVALLALTAIVSVGLAVVGAIAVARHQERKRDEARQAYEDSLAQVKLTTTGPALTAQIIDEEGRMAVPNPAVPFDQWITLPPGNYLLRINGPWKAVDFEQLLLAPGEQKEVPIVWAGEVTFTTDGPPLVGEVLDADGQSIIPAFPIPTEHPIVLPQGAYMLKLRGPWLPVEYEPLHVRAGEHRKMDLKLIGRLSLTSNGPPLMGEVLNPKGERIVPAFTLPTPEPISLPAGDHTLRLTCPGLWTETYDFTLRRGELVSHSLNLNDRAFGAPIKLTYTTDRIEPADAWVVTRNGKTDVIQVTKDGLKRIEWATGRQVWAEVPAHPDIDTAPFVGSATAGKWGPFFHSRMPNTGDNNPLPAHARLVQPAADLDGDGEPDLLFVSRWVPGLMAVSGKTGKVLWYHTNLPPVSAEMNAAGWKATPMAAYVPMGEPVLHDIDGDGVPDVITAVHARGVHWVKVETKENKYGGSGVWIEAISGKTGKLLWSSWLEEPGTSKTASLAFASHLTKLDGKVVLAVLAGRFVAVFDVMTGKFIRGPFTLDFTPLGVPKVRAGERPLFLVGRRREREDELVAVEALDGKLRWSHALGFYWPTETLDDGAGISSRIQKVSPRDWPELADLNGDGADEVLVPLAHQADPGWKERSGGGVVALDGETGKRLWEYRFPPPKEGYQNGYCRLKVIPDVTGDGKPDVVVARCHWVTYHSTQGGGRFTDFGVAVLSGSDGKPLWHWNRQTVRSPLMLFDQPHLGRLATWSPGRDGKPQLVVPVVPDGADTADLLLFDSKTGRFDREVKQFGEPIVADLDGDGLPDLYAYQPAPSTSPFMGEFSLAAIRGMCPDEWRRIDAGWPGPDLDGDGVPDLLNNESLTDPATSRILAARSGATGRLLWRCELDATAIHRRWQTEDLNGDGVPDVLVLCARTVQAGHPVRVAAVCGKTGRVLWQSQDLSGTVAGKSGYLSEQLLFLRPVRLRAGETPTIVGLTWLWGEQGHLRYYAFALSGTDGRLLWQTPVGPEVKVHSMSSPTTAPALADLDGDGVQDLVFWVGSHHLAAVSGANGRVLWERDVAGSPSEQPRWNQQIFAWDTARVDYPAPAVADLDGRGTFAVAYVHRPKDRDRVVVLNGKDGTERWAWEGPPVRTPAVFAPADVMTVPRFVRLKEGTFLLGVACGTTPPRMKDEPPGVARHLVLLDVAGKEHQRRELPGLSDVSAFLNVFPLWVGDLDGDGFDEIAFVADADKRFVVTRGGLKDEAWSLAHRENESVFTVRFASGEKPGTVVFRSENTVRGFGAKSGRPLWACSGLVPGPCLQPADPTAPPIVLFPMMAHGAIARRAVPVTSDGKFLVPGVK